ncbi:hypothetical protein ACGFZP_13250 [Kitasatospora sp. NPDC048239]|uniref:hypothetical protein n=1 Tax=Kitasatospora sp. NPDC048239 TaxID=3364046 RepID=UPI00371824AC
MIATTTVTVLRGTSSDPYNDDVDLPVEAGADAQTRIPASLIEGSRTITTPNNPTPRVVRYAVARVRPGTDVTEEDRLRDDRTGRIYEITAVTQPSAVGFTPMLRLDLKLIN